MKIRKKKLKVSDSNLALVYKFYFNGSYKKALSALDALTHDFPKDSLLYSIGGDCYISLAEYEKALLCYEEAIKLSPDNILLFRKTIETLGLCGKIEESLKLCNKAINIAPDNSDLYLLQGKFFQKSKNFTKAIDSYNQVIKISPNNVDAFNNKAHSLESLRDFEAAVVCAKKAIEIKNDYSPAFFNLGVSAMHLRLFDLSMQSFNKAIKLEPNCEKYKFAKATLLLMYGDFKNGWALWESRWKLDKLFSPKLETNRPVWTGNKNAKLLVWPEQGIGDQILYSPLLFDLNEKCSELIVILDSRLITLLTRSIGDFCTLYPDNGKESELDFDEHIPMGSLCQYFRINEKDFESSRYGILKDDTVKTAHIKKNILSSAPLNNKLCGISWKSSNKNVHKNIPLKSFIESLDLKGYTYVNLQYGDTADEIKLVRDELGIDIISYDEVDNFNDIDGLTSLIQACDVVISIDNLTCQLSGALGKKTHLLLTYGGGWWGWMADRSDSPWYNSVKIYRQGSDRNLSNLFLQLKQEL